MTAPSTRTYAGALAASLAVVAVLYFAADSRSQDVRQPLPRTPIAPADNPTTPAKVALGRALFWDPILSGPRDVACASCHHPQFGYAENRDLSIGVTGTGLGHRRRFAAGTTIPFVKRNSQTILNVAFNGADESARYDPSAAPMFWDVRASSLERQSLEPIKALEEMRGTTYAEEAAVDAVVARLRAIPEYGSLFSTAFGARDALTADNLARALAAFQRTLLANDAPFDRYMRGDERAMTDAQIRGLRRFERIGCVNCHNGPMFSDYKVHVLGVPDHPSLPATDAGVEGTYAFRTASLRNLRFTAPYMHTGRFETLPDVLEFYDDVDGGGGRGGRRARARNINVSRDQLDPLVRRLRGVDDDDEDLLAFLDALSDDSFDRTIPARVPSGLPVGGAIQ
jgi:cytochrome c peroxidase